MSIKLGTNTINAIKLGTNAVSKVCVGSVEIYNSNPIDYTVPFYIENPDSTDHDASFIIVGDTGEATLYYSYSPLHAETGQYIDDNDFDGYIYVYNSESGVGYTKVTIPAESRVYLYIDSRDMYGDNLRHLSDGTSYFNIDGGDITNIGGNIMSLLYGEYFTGNERSFDAGSTHNFFQLFADSMNINDASDLLLPATTLTANCYQNMFMNSALSVAPTTLPAQTLAGLCYANMFYNCSALTTAPSLPATTLAIRCYYNMFFGCTSLTTAPALPAQTLATNCYEQMFQGCSQLSSVSVGATSWDTNNTAWWLYQVSATGTFTKPSGTTIPESASGIPSGWTVVNK